MATTTTTTKTSFSCSNFQTSYSKRNPNCSSSSLRLLRTIPKSSLRKLPKEDLKPKQKKKLVNPLTNSFFSKFSHRIRVDEIGLEILSIAFPAALALAADPIASLVDSAFVGHLGSAELAAVGVSISVFNLVSKLLNVPLLNITTSFVAEEQALASYGNDISLGINTSDQGFDDTSVLQEPLGENKKPFPAVSASLALAAGIGIAEAITLSTGSGSLMNIMGISVDSPMRLPAEQFLALRAFGAPPIVIALYGYEDTSICHSYWQLTECDIGSSFDLFLRSGHWGCSDIYCDF